MRIEILEQIRHGCLPALLSLRNLNEESRATWRSLSGPAFPSPKSRHYSNAGKWVPLNAARLRKIEMKGWGKKSPACAGLRLLTNPISFGGVFVWS
jgi:hypothetical protein